eukprot:TRINITY_DN8691_c0_g1_i1.p1 TRINITY_DN8691_c0_g1~~TRINITY_DN8691_c0_g1_i1.p1  ORF type:complete len:119 (-),score=27.51 TRINITY_DN8691_c0_g1_i1:126-482(-)
MCIRDRYQRRVHGDWTELNKCAHSASGQQLLHEAGKATRTFASEKEYVPYILQNGKHNKEAEDLILNDLTWWACQNVDHPSVKKKCEDVKPEPPMDMSGMDMHGMEMHGMNMHGMHMG